MNSAITVVYKVNNEQRHVKYIVEFSRNLKYFLKIPRIFQVFPECHKNTVFFLRFSWFVWALPKECIILSHQNENWDQFMEKAI